FFFSSRRRHTRWPRDWSSDVCSSDLWAVGRYQSGGSEQTLAEYYLAPCATPTPSPQASPTACPVQYTDVDGTNPFYTYIRCLARSEERRVGKPRKGSATLSPDHGKSW